MTNNYRLWFILLLVTGISDIILGLNKVTNTTKPSVKLVDKKLSSKINKLSIPSPKNTSLSNAKNALNKKAVNKPTFPIKLITQKPSSKDTTKANNKNSIKVTTKEKFKPSNKSVKFLHKSLLWFEVFYITSENVEPDETFPVDEGFILVTVKKPTIKMKPTTTKQRLSTRAFTESPTRKTHSSAQSSGLQSTYKTKIANDKSLAKPGQRKLLQFHISQSHQCKNNSQCQRNNSEICLTRDQRRECGCLPGFSRHHANDSTCHAFKAFKCTIWLEILFNERYKDFQSLEFLEISAILMDVLKAHLSLEDEASQYKKYFIKMIPSRFSSYKDDVNKTVAECYLLFHKNEIQNVKATSIQNWLHNMTSDKRVKEFLINDLYVCNDMELNYCSLNADCTFHAQNHSATCKCKQGFKDISDNLLLPPGAECEDICYADYCLHGGKCITSDNEKQCICTTWFVMGRCELDLRWVLPVAGSCLVVALIFVFSAVHIYYKEKKKYIKRPQNFGREPNSEDGLFKRYEPNFPLDIPVSLGQDNSLSHSDHLSEISQNYFPRARLKL